MAVTARPRPRLVVGLNAVIAAVTEEVPRILVVDAAGEAGADTEALPAGPLDPAGHHTLERGLRAWVAEQTGLDLGYVEQLYTFGDLLRDPHAGRGGERHLTVAYLALVQEADSSEPIAGRAQWRPVYEFLPWEDWRAGRPQILESRIQPALRRWCAASRSLSERESRRERVDISFGLEGAPWDGDRVLDRYELLYEAGLVAERHRDAAVLAKTGRLEGKTPARFSDAPASGTVGRALALDHRRILATSLGRLRGKLRYRPVVFELLPPKFTLLQLQRLVEALAGLPLHKQNFRRLVETQGLVEGTGETEASAKGRPAELFRFRRSVLRERPAPGVRLPRPGAAR